jgi:hypothetical protein
MSWTNPYDITSSNNLYAYVERGYSTSTQYLTASNFGFTIPSGAVITGITAEIEKSCYCEAGVGSTRNVTDYLVQIVKASGVYGLTNKPISGSWPNFTDTIFSYGGTSDVWGESWTSADINNTNFGVALMAYITSDGPFVMARVDSIRITVHYTESPPLSVNIGGSWHNYSEGYVKIDGVWRPVASIHTNIGGTWKQS